ncbi:MAG: energy transducer TonB [Thermoanaerobaculales bacterium]
MGFRELWLRHRRAWTGSLAGLVMYAAVSMLVLPAARSNAEEQPAGLALAARALRLYEMRPPEAAAVRLRAHVKLLGLVSGTREGDYLLVFLSPERWFEQTLFPGYSELAGVAGNERWRKRNVVDKPFRMHELSAALDLSAHLRTPPDVRIVKSWDETVLGTPASCIRVAPSSWLWQKGIAGRTAANELKREEDKKVALCFASAEGRLLKADYGFTLPRYEYEGNMTLGATSYPKVLRCYEESSLVVEATVTEFIADPGQTDPAAFVPPAGAEKWPACATPEPPRAAARYNLSNDAYSKARRIFGTVLFQAEIGTDGTIHDLAPLELKHADLTVAVQDTVAKWHYQPATCGGTPVPYEFFFALTFPP